MTVKKAHGHAAAAKRRLTKKQKFLEAYEKSMCNVTAACKATNTSRNTYYKWLHEDEKFANACQDAEDSNLDYAETKLMASIRDNNLTAIIFYLKTKGKKRGYVESAEIEERRTTDINLSGLTDDELVNFEKLMRKCKSEQ